MTTLVLVLNAGSSTLKYQVVDPENGTATVQGVVDRVGGAEMPDHEAALDAMRADLAHRDVDVEALAAVGHRVVHGGPRLVRPVLVDDEVLAEIDALARLAPLHNPAAAAGIRSARDHFAHVPQVAVFDTAFFADLPAAAATYALDLDLARREGIRRYGAHGISHEYAAGAAADLLDRPVAELDQIILHLGNGASAAAVRGGRAVDTSMGMTPMEGLVMGTRSGDVDPGVLVHLARHAGLDIDQIDELLNHGSGLLGLSGHSDFRDLLTAVDAGDERARLAYDVCRHRLRKYVGAYLAVLGSADTVVFTGGVGEHSHRLRSDVLAGLSTFGLVVDESRNRASSTEPRLISPQGSGPAVIVVPTNEELAIARATMSLVGGR